MAKVFTVTMEFSMSLDARNEEQAQERAEAIQEAMLTTGISGLLYGRKKVRWQVPDIECDSLEVAEED